jgi:uncharacterized coiled-coil protein SlyX
MENKDIWAIVAGFVSLFLMYLLNLRDAHQQKDLNELKKSIDDLYSKHNSDSDRLQKLELDVARNNYTKEEINQMLVDLKNYMCELFDRLEQTIKAQKND